ncbi:MAG: phosphoadenosine phosphosulfate reductase family protein [Lachnospiraceae bacterium]|jgi:phosphoadenosine phosphosulfate reductase|nr:phosphoadenosine phosphosulfate reductase family protein [Lachnospiraceae bacterium]
MYSYTYSKETGGVALNSTPTKMSKEPRPVYAPELDLLGFDKYWKYDKQSDTPYLWAEANRYYYRGRLVASLLGGDVYHAPVIQLAYVCREWRETPKGKAIEKTECKNPEEVGGWNPEEEEANHTDQWQGAGGGAGIGTSYPDKRSAAGVTDERGVGAQTGATYSDKRGNVFVLDLPEAGGRLRPIDIPGMVAQNREILGWLEETTAKKILAVYEKYARKLDVFHVAFSGGKDSCVLLDLVKSVLPKDSFVVVFGDTGMEFPDTYDVIDQTEEMCRREGIKFYRASSHLKPEESWGLFAPPSRVLRWCCSVHKSTPQTLKLREVTGKPNYTGLDYVGVRAQESVARSEYEYENYGKKQKGQYSHNPILEWTSAEIWLYIYARNLLINRAYKKGNPRAGCIFCPMSGGAGDYVRRQCYTQSVDNYVDNIKRRYYTEKRNPETIDSYFVNGGWSARKNGRELTDNEFRCIERHEGGLFCIDVVHPSSNWREWMKTVDDTHIDYKVEETKTGYTVVVSESFIKENPVPGRLFRQVFRKAAYCIGCRVCEANCKNGCIRFEQGKVKIDGCLHCGECHSIDSGCLLFHSLRHPQGGGKSMKSLNSFADHAPKPDWLRSYFDLKEGFFAEHSLGPMMFDMFRRFLKDAGLSEKNHFTPLAEIVAKIGYDSDTAMGIVYVNLAYENPQIEWYIQNMEIGRVYERKAIEETLVNIDVKPKDAKSIAKAFKRLTETPLGTKLHFGFVDGDYMARTVCSVSDPKVVLYALYRFAEKCNDYKEFTLHALLSEGIDRDGVSPTRIFGLDRETMTPILLGLTAQHPDFINATFTNDLDKISLKDDKTSADVLGLFQRN